VRKHAGQTRVLVSLQRHGSAVRLVVRDWGRGFATQNGRHRPRSGEHMGLLGMRERLALLGGRWSVRSAPGQGTQIVAEVPASNHSQAEGEAGAAAGGVPGVGRDD
jgi:two-component system, NarL family, sensor histidine kinase DegS